MKLQLFKCYILIENNIGTYFLDKQKNTILL